MAEDRIQHLKENIMAIGRLLWEKEIASGLNGNISTRVDEGKILLTAHSTCLGLLDPNDILLTDLNGQILDGSEAGVSTEKLLHTEIYKNFPSVKAVIHTHTTYTNAFFLHNEKLTPEIFEAKFYLGEVKGVRQLTPAVTDMAPVVEALKTNNIVALRNHGVVAMGEDLFDCFLLIQALEDAVKIDAISRLYQSPADKTKRAAPVVKSIKDKAKRSKAILKKYKLFSKEQIAKIVDLVNHDAALADLGLKTKMTMDLAVKLNETGQTYSFAFENGRIKKVGNNENVEFLITAPEKVWRAVFNREIDPFVATTQKKMHLKGDFAKISKWYAPCSRVFQLWQSVPVE